MPDISYNYYQEENPAMKKNLFYKLLAGLTVCAMLFCSVAALADAGSDNNPPASSGTIAGEVRIEAVEATNSEAELPAAGENPDANAADEAEVPAGDETPEEGKAAEDEASEAPEGEKADESGFQIKLPDVDLNDSAEDVAPMSLLPDHVCVFEEEASEDLRTGRVNRDWWYDDEYHATDEEHMLIYHCTEPTCTDFYATYYWEIIEKNEHVLDENGACTICDYDPNYEYPDDPEDPREPEEETCGHEIDWNSSVELVNEYYSYLERLSGSQDSKGHFVVTYGNWAGECKEEDCEINRTYGQREIYVAEPHTFKNGKCACGYKTATSTTEAIRYRIATKLVSEIRAIEANGGTVTIVNEEMAYTDTELASVRGIAKAEERALALLVALGIDAEVDYTVKELDITLSTEAQNLIATVKARVATGGVLAAASSAFPTTAETVDGVSRDTIHIMLTATYADGSTTTSRFCFYKDGKWYFNTVHA